MVSRDAGKLVIWPHYFDRGLSRARGRRVSLDLAVDEPRAGAIANAARTLGLKAELDEDSRPPSAWPTRRGRVLVDRTGESKEAVLKQIARRL